MDPLRSAARAASSAAGQALRAATALMGSRPAAKPLHPRGTVTPATLRRFGADEQSGAAWLDATGEDTVLVRQSRAAGLPAPLPDFFGLAIRVPIVEGDDRVERHGDLLLATTGLGRLTRFTLTPATSAHGRPMTTLLPYRTPTGAVLLSATFRGERTLDLAWAHGRGAWHRFAELQIHGDPASQDDEPISFDPLLNTLPGLTPYDWVRRLREPAYAAARRSRRG